MVHNELVGASDVGHSVGHHHGLLHVGVRVVHQADVVLEEPAVVVVQTHDELVDARVGGVEGTYSRLETSPRRMGVRIGARGLDASSCEARSRITRRRSAWSFSS